MPGVVIVASKTSIGQAVTDLLGLINNTTFDTAWDGQVHHLPLR